MNALQTVMSVYITVCLCESVCIRAYREHWGGKKTPCKKLQEDDHHGMVNTGLTDSLRLDGDGETHTNRKTISSAATDMFTCINVHINGTKLTDQTLYY